MNDSDLLTGIIAAPNFVMSAQFAKAANEYQTLIGYSQRLSAATRLSSQAKISNSLLTLYPYSDQESGNTL